MGRNVDLFAASCSDCWIIGNVCGKKDCQLVVACAQSPVPIVEERQQAVPLSYHIACKQINLVDVERAKELLKGRKKRKPKKDHRGKRKDRKRRDRITTQPRTSICLK